MKKLLVVVDMQNDFVSGSLGSEAAKNAVGEVKRLIARERARGADAAFTLDTHGEDYADTQEGRLLPVRHCMRNTAGWNVVPELVSETEGAVLFEKETFASVQLAEYAKKGGYGEITLCGYLRGEQRDVVKGVLSRKRDQGGGACVRGHESGEPCRRIANDALLPDNNRITDKKEKPPRCNAAALFAFYILL